MIPFIIVWISMKSTDVTEIERKSEGIYILDIVNAENQATDTVMQSNCS